MAALAANKSRITRGIQHVRKLGTMLAANSITLYEGALVIDNASGKVAVGADTAGAQVLGVNPTYKVTGTSADHYPQIEWGHEEWFVNDGNVTAAMIGQNCTILDDATVSVSGTTTNDVPVGKILELETIGGVAGVWVAVGVFGTTTA